MTTASSDGLAVRWRPALRATSLAALDAILSVVLVTSAAGTLAAWSNGYLQSGLWHLPVLETADRAGQILLPAMMLSAWTSAVAGFLRTRGARTALAAPAVGLLSVGAALAGWAFLARLHGSSHGPTGAVEPLVAGCARFGVAGWTAVGVVVSALAVSRARGTLPSSSGRLRRRAAAGAGGILAVFAAAVGVVHLAVGGSPARPNVLLIVLDTVSAGHMAPFGYRRVTTPEVDALSGRGMRFSRAFAPAPWTLPSHASIFTGFASVRHGATQENLLLDLRFDTLAELLRDAGYETFAAVGNPVVGHATQLDQGFGELVETWRYGIAARHGRSGRHPDVEALASFLDRRSRGTPFLAFLNFNDAHAPYRPSAGDAAKFLPPDVELDRANGIDQSWRRYYAGLSRLSREDFDRLNDLYDAELARVSRGVGDAVSELSARGLLEKTVVIVTADHGENIGDHGHLDHVFTLYDTLLHVPLVMFGPGVPRGVTVERPVTLTALFTTILAAAGVGQPSRPDVEDLRRAAEAPRAETPLVAEYYFPRQALSLFEPAERAAGSGRLAPYLRRLRAVRTLRWKFIWSSNGRHELYDAVSDPAETADLAADRPDTVREMIALLNTGLSRLAGRRFSIDDEPPPEGVRGFVVPDRPTRDRLKSLGYIR
jgi:arylsulfatase A-like enzyme